MSDQRPWASLTPAGKAARARRGFTIDQTPGRPPRIIYVDDDGNEATSGPTSDAGWCSVCAGPCVGR